MTPTRSESSAALRQFIYSRAHQMSLQITRAAEEFGAQSAERREHERRIADEALRSNPGSVSPE